MGLLDILGIFGSATSKAEQAAMGPFLRTKKKGKRDLQKKCIDFLYDVEMPRKKGCFGKTEIVGMYSGNKLMSMSEYKSAVYAAIKEMDFKKKALERIGLDESQVSEIPPINVSYFELKGDGVATKSKETDVAGVWETVSNKYHVAWVFFSDKQIYTYEYTYDSTSDDSYEYTRDFFYGDVTCIRTEHETVEKIIERKELTGCINKKEESKFFHHNLEYSSFYITVPDDSFSFHCAMTDTLEQSIQAAKAMIREKKNG